MLQEVFETSATNPNIHATYHTFLKAVFIQCHNGWSVSWYSRRCIIRLREHVDLEKTPAVDLVEGRDRLIAVDKTNRLLTWTKSELKQCRQIIQDISSAKY
jgi:hypothetical protein